MRGRLIDLSIGMNRKQRITIEVDRDFREDFDRLREAELDVEIKKHRTKTIGVKLNFLLERKYITWKNRTRFIR